jgi:hypothetical protein
VAQAEPLAVVADQGGVVVVAVEQEHLDKEITVVVVAAVVVVAQAVLDKLTVLPPMPAVLAE